MAKKKGSKALDVQIKELEAAIKEVRACAACGKAVEPDALTCPHCGAALGEGADLQVEAAKSLEDLEMHLEAAVDTEPKPEAPADVPAPEAEPESTGLGTAAEVATVVEPEPEPSKEPETSEETEPAAEPAPTTEASESPDLAGFIQEIEAEVTTPPEDSPMAARVHAVPRAAALRRPSRWVAPVAGGAFLYFVGLLTVFSVLPDFGKPATASVMVLASVLVAVGMNLRPGGASPPPPARAVPREGAPDYVCPLCGTGIPTGASECPTCGALFED